MHLPQEVQYVPQMIIISSCVCDSLNKESQLFSFGFSLTYLRAFESMFSLNTLMYSIMLNITNCTYWIFTETSGWIHNEGSSNYFPKQVEAQMFNLREDGPWLLDQQGFVICQSVIKAEQKNFQTNIISSVYPKDSIYKERFW